MNAVIAAAVVWALTVVLLLVKRNRFSNPITWAAVCCALALTVNVDAVHVRVDRVLGGHNFAELLGDCALVVGLWCLGRAVRAASGRRSLWLGRQVLSLPVLCGVLVVMAVSFAGIRTGGTAEDFMVTYGAQPAAAVFSMVQYVYAALVMGGTARLAWQVASARGETRRSRVGGLLLAAGGVLGVATGLVVVGMDVTHLAGADRAMHVLQGVYGPAYVGAVVLVCAGLVLPPVTRWSCRAWAWTAMRWLVHLLRPVWEQVAATGEDPRPRGDRAEDRLYRMVIELRDAQVRPDVLFRPDPRTERRLDAAERWLTPQHPQGATPPRMRAV